MNPQSENRITQMVQAQTRAVHHLLIKILRAVRRIAIAISAGDEEGGIKLPQHIRRGVHHVFQDRIIPALTGNMGRFFCAGFRVS